MTSTSTRRRSGTIRIDFSDGSGPVRRVLRSGRGVRDVLLVARLWFGRFFWRRELGSLPLYAAEHLPRDGTGSRRQFFDEHVLHLHDRVAAPLNLDADDAIARDIWILFQVVHALH